MRRLKEEEDGATVVMVALLVVPLIVAAAFVMDFGLIYWEARQLQNGADAAALAVAQDCAAGETCTPAAAEPTAQQYANANANDGASAVLEIAIPGQSGPNSVTVTVGTRSDAGEPFLTHVLSSVIGIDTSTWERSATVSWGAMGGGTTLPIGICEDAWDHYADELPSDPGILRIGVPPGHVDGDIDCSNPGGGDTPPGGFAFLSADGNCQAEVYEGEWIDGSNGNTPDVQSSGCSADKIYKMLFDAVNDGNELLVPIFDRYEDQGSQGRYRVIGFGAFVLHGYSINGGPAPSNKDHGRDYEWSDSCPGSASCLKLHFDRFVALGGELSNDPENGFGTSLVYFTG